MSEKTSLGLSENLEGALAYLLGPITGFILLILEKENKFVRFHSLQSFIVITPLIILQAIVKIVPFLGGLLNWCLGIVIAIVALFLIFNALMGKIFKVPFVGNAIYNQIYK